MVSIKYMRKSVLNRLIAGEIILSNLTTKLFMLKVSFTRNGNELRIKIYSYNVLILSGKSLSDITSVV